MNILLHTLPNGDQVVRDKGVIAVTFGGARKVLSTCAMNGGYCENLNTVFNHDATWGQNEIVTMKGKNMYEHMRTVTDEIGFDPNTTAGMETSAHMENVSIKSNCFPGVGTVTAIVTGGIDVNGGRVGDPATWIERDGETPEHKPGTINIILAFDADLSKGCMARALVTCTEAKTAAIGELLAPSMYSRGIATGSGTDDTIIISDPASEIHLSNAGKHSKLGELIGITVKAAVKEALDLQTGMNAVYQHNAINRMSRFGVRREEFPEGAEQMICDGETVGFASVAAHAIDQMDWGLLPAAESISTVKMMAEGYCRKRGISYDWQELDEPDEEIIWNWKKIISKEIVHLQK